MLEEVLFMIYLKEYNPGGKIIKLLLSIGAGILGAYTSHSGFFEKLFLFLAMFLVFYALGSLYGFFVGATGNYFIAALFFVGALIGISIGMAKLAEIIPDWFENTVGPIIMLIITAVLVFIDIRNLIRFYFGKNDPIQVEVVQPEYVNAPAASPAAYPEAPAYAEEYIPETGIRSAIYRAGAIRPDYSRAYLNQVLVPDGISAAVTEASLTYIAAGMTLDDVCDFYLRITEALGMAPLSEGFQVTGDPNIFSYAVQYQRMDEAFARNLTILVQAAARIQVSVYFSADSV